MANDEQLGPVMDWSKEVTLKIMLGAIPMLEQACDAVGLTMEAQGRAGEARIYNELRDSLREQAMAKYPKYRKWVKAIQAKAENQSPIILPPGYRRK